MRRLAQIHHVENKKSEPIWHVQLALLLVIALQFMLDSALSVAPKYFLVGAETAMLVILILVAEFRASLSFRRMIAFVLLGVVTAANIVSLILVIVSLFNEAAFTGGDLLISALSIFMTNIIVFGLWYWEMDYLRDDKPLHFIFAQESASAHSGLPSSGWHPTFFDYLYLSVVNAVSFSPTDTQPLTHSAKALMAIQSIISIIIVVLVTARAVSIIG